jgi:hypothetical protein
MDKNGELAGAVEASNNGSGSEGRLRLRPWVVAVSFAVGIHAYAASLWLSINLPDIPVDKHVVGADIAALLVPAMLLLALSLRAWPEICCCFHGLEFPSGPRRKPLAMRQHRGATSS